MRVIQVPGELAYADAIGETQRGIKMLAQLDVAQIAAPPVETPNAKSGPERSVVAVQAGRRGFLVPRIALRGTPARQARIQIAKIHPEHGVIQVGTWIAIGHDHTEIGLVEHIGHCPADEQVGRFHLLIAGLADIDDAEVPAADPAGQLCPCFDLHGLPRLAQADRAREERPAVVGARAAAAELPSGEARELEYVGVLQEEITFFRE